MISILIMLLVSAIINIIIYGACVIAGSFVIWMTVDAAKQDRFWWVVLILGIPFIGAAVYYLTEKKREYAKAPSRHIHESETETQHETSHTQHKKHKKMNVIDTVPQEEKGESHETVEENTETVTHEHKEEKEESK